MPEPRRATALPEGSIAEVPLARDVFFQGLMRHLAGSLQDIVGMDETESFISLVGQRMGGEMEAMYRESLRLPRLDRDHVARVMVDLKARIGGDFYVVEESPERIVLGNRTCPFGEMVRGRPALCMMTSNVLGTVAAQNLGYARVEIAEAIARGHDGCRVVVTLDPPPEGRVTEGREYFRTREQPA